MDKRTIKKVIDVADSLGWSVTHNKGEFEFQKFSPAGQDFNMCIPAVSLIELKDELYGRWNDFDCSEEAHVWLDDSGHGKNGAPYDMKDLYEDMEACQDMIEELYDNIREITIEPRTTSQKSIRDQTR